MPMTEVEKWIQRLRRAEKVHKEKREETARYKKGYTGNFELNKDTHVGKYTLKVNFIYYFVETIMGTMFAGEPKIRVKAKKDPTLDPAAELLEYNTNYWAKEVDARSEIKDCLFDS